MSLMTSRRSWPTFLAVMAVSALGLSANAGELKAPAYVYHGSDDAAFAVGLRLPEPTAQITRHVLLVDTSASQIGEHRRQVISVLNELLAQLPADSEVALLATDVQTVDLTEGFVGPHSDSMKSAMQKLQRRAPLGATDLAGALTSVFELNSGSEPVSIGYIGDGMSAARLIEVETLKLLSRELREQKIVVNSYAIGPQTDLQLLAILAQQTGGRILVDSESSAEQVAGSMVKSLQTGVAYPEELTLSGSEAELIVQSSLPLRSDETLFLLGSGLVSESTMIAATLGDRTIRWNVEPKTAAGNQTFLNAALQNARGTQGLFAAYPNESLLLQSADAFSSQLERMKELAQYTLSTQHFEQAREIALAMRELDPQNVDAGALLVAAQKKEQVVALAQNEQPAEQPERVIGDADLDLTEQTQQRMALRTQQLTLEINNLITEARKLASSDPSNALVELKKALNDVTSAIDINEVSRDQLIKRLNSVIQEVQSQLEVRQLQQSQSLEKQVQEQALERLREEMELDDEKFEQLLERVRSLMVDGRHGIEGSFDSAALVAAEAIAIRPESGPATSAFFKSETAMQLERSRRLRFIRAREFLNVLHEVEKSHVPFPDEPPVVWPAAEVWQDLTERRKIWKRTNLRNDSPTEASILQALDEPYQAEFFDMPLTDVIDDIKVNKRIPIIIDPNVIENVDTGQTINLSLSGVSLRSILKMILQPLEMTYIIEDEVMKITTLEEAEQKFFIYVYPVGDLVITPIALQMATGAGGQGGFGQGGAFGGQQGGQNQFGGGGQGGGMGGGGFGGGGFGGGGGFFSVAPPRLFNAPQRQAAPPAGVPNRLQQRINDAEIQQLLNENLGPQSSLDSKPTKFQAQIRDTGAPRLDNNSLQQLKKKR